MTLLSLYAIALPSLPRQNACATLLLYNIQFPISNFQFRKIRQDLHLKSEARRVMARSEYSRWIPLTGTQQLPGRLVRLLDSLW